MASFQRVSREVVRLSGQSVRRNANSRGFKSCSRCLAAQNFTMPAMSPTMTEGNIASWKVKEGDTFSTGDVLLEIETDKAQMDVEAQEDGKMAKITQEAGAKGVKVGSRIAILAEAEDDLSTLSLPAEEPAPQSSPAPESPKPTTQASEGSKPQAESPPTPSGSPGSAKAQKQTYPLYPSISQLLHENGVPLSEADNIPASGPKGRLLKGDVLAYLGQIDKSYPSEQSVRITKLGHLDLSNVKAAPPKKPDADSKPAPAPSTAPPAPEPEPNTEIAVSISLSSVLFVQKRIKETLGISLPLSTFLARAAELANEDLPRASNRPPTADELFNDVLGLSKVSPSTSRGHYIPQITALPATSATSVRPSRPRNGSTGDIYDLLTSTGTGNRTTPPPAPASTGLGPKTGETTNVFSVSAAKGEEVRARTFLERVKTILQVEPGRLIL